MFFRTLRGKNPHWKKFRKPIALGLTLISAAWVTSCTFRQKAPSSAQFNVNSDLSCMDNIAQVNDDFFAGTATEEQLTDTWNCSSHALDEFMQKVKGATPGVYRAVELRGFFQRYYIHKMDLTDDFLEAAGEVKQVLVGGEVDQVTVAEIQQIQAILGTLRDVTLSLRPYMPISMSGIQNRPWSDLSESEIDAFSATIDQAATQLAQVLESVGATYTFAQFNSLLTAIQGALPPGEDRDTLAGINSLRSHLALAQQAKAFIATPDLPNIGSKGNWKILLSTTSSLATMALKTRWLMDSKRLSQEKDSHFPNETLTRDHDLANLNTIVNEATSLLKQSIARHPNQIIEFGDLVDLINLIPDDAFPVSKASIISLIVARQGQPYSLIARVIGGQDFSSDGRAAKGLTSGFVDHITAAFSNWYEGQRFLDALFDTIGNSDNDLGGDLLESTIFKSAPALKLWGEVYGQSSSEWNKTTLIAAKRLESAIREIPPLYYLTSSDQVSFPVDYARQAYTFHDLSQVNWIQMAAMMVIQGYMNYDPTQPLPARAADPSQMALNQSEFQNFFDDLKPFGIQIKLFDPYDENSAPSRFREIEVFTYASNGDGYMNVDEAVEYVALSFSAFSSAALMHQDISALCQADQAADPKHATTVIVKGDNYGEDLIEPTCYRKHFFGRYDTYWNPMYTAERFYQSLGSSQRESYDYLLEVAARKFGYTDAVWVDSADSQSFIAVLQYIEAVFSRYDIKRTGYISEGEAKVAFPVFKGVLETIAAGETPPVNLSDTTAEWVFDFMLANGSLPDTAHHKIRAAIELLWQAGKDAINSKLPFLGSFKADRLRLLDIMGALSEASGIPPLPGTITGSPLPSPSASPSRSVSPMHATPTPSPSVSGKSSIQGKSQKNPSD